MSSYDLRKGIARIRIVRNPTRSSTHSLQKFLYYWCLDCCFLVVLRQLVVQGVVDIFGVAQQGHKRVFDFGSVRPKDGRSFWSRCQVLGPLSHNVIVGIKKAQQNTSYPIGICTTILSGVRFRQGWGSCFTWKLPRSPPAYRNWRALVGVEK